MEELANAGIKMAEINKLKDASIATVGAVLATPTKACCSYIATERVDDGGGSGVRCIVNRTISPSPLPPLF